MAGSRLVAATDDAEDLGAGSG